MTRIFAQQSRRLPPRGAQRGVVLLALMLVLLVASSYVLVANLNEQARETTRDIETQRALREAKQALLNYAMNYPDLSDRDDRGPGFLPCPDQGTNTTPDPIPDQYEESLNDGLPEANCSENTGTTLGRLPIKELGLSDLRDGSGERLWYAVSGNFQYNQDSDYLINSETPEGTIVVDTEEDIVAVVIAPGESLAGQERRRNTDEVSALASRLLYSVADQYLEHDNAAVGAGNTAYVTDSDGDFNDQLVAITRAELVAAMEQRVAGEVRGMLQTYRDSHGAFPWLAPFADPKAGSRYITGAHTGPDDSKTSLQDSGVDFVESGVAAGDTVWNITDGSRGIVTAVSANTLTIGGGMFFGTDNDFDSADSEDNGDDTDRYVVQLQAPAARFIGTAVFGSNATFLRDTSRDFEDLGVRSGDIVDNITDGSSGAVSEVLQHGLRFDKLSGGAIDAFQSGHRYRIRNSAGRATASNPAVLEDDDADFEVMGVTTGDLVFNVSGNSYGVVQSVSSPTTLTVANVPVDPATSIGFVLDDYYAISRYKGSTGTIMGLIPFHQPGEAFRTGFDMEWATTAGTGSIVTAEEAGTYTTYNNGRTNWATRTTNFAGTVEVDDGACIWIGKQVVSCRGTKTIDDYFSASADSVSDLGSLIQIGNDGSYSFPANGVGAGARITNTSNGKVGIVQSAPTATPSLMRVASIAGRPAFAVQAGDEFRIRVPAERCPNSASCPAAPLSIATSYTAGIGTNTATNTVCVDAASGVNFLDVFGTTPAIPIQTTDVIRRTASTLGNPVGSVTGVSALCLTYSDLQGGTAATIPSGSTFRVYFNFVAERTYTYNVQLSGSYTYSSVDGGRKRTIVDISLKGDGANPFVTLEDTAEGMVLGRTTVTIPAHNPVTGNPTAFGSVTVADMDFQWYEDDGTDDDGVDGAHDGSIDGFELPSWFIANRWHELIYIAYSSGLQPGGSGACVAGTDCLTLRVDKNSAEPGYEREYPDREAVVLMAGVELDTIDVQQDRTSGQLSDYFEDDNADENLIFETRDDPTSINDQAGSIAP